MTHTNNPTEHVTEKDFGDPTDLRTRLIDKLDDQRFADTPISDKLLYADIEYVVDELLPLFTEELEKLKMDNLLSLDFGHYSIPGLVIYVNRTNTGKKQITMTQSFETEAQLKDTQQ